jgi:F420-dependent methylenetetrahydromethanopterin dehydrogenase
MRFSQMSDFRIIQEAYDSMIDEILVGGKKLTSKQIVKKIKKNKSKLPTLRDFESIFAKFYTVVMI